jgi:CO dehydrogenase/acetyl-CoA synthase delta subunit
MIGSENMKGTFMMKEVVGAKIYNVWLDMLKSLVPHGRTHRLSVMVAGMLQYAQEVAYKKAESNSKARKLAESFESAFESSDEEYLNKIIEIAGNLFEDAGVRYKRKNRKGESYSIAEEAAYEFLNWENMPWER